ncbi:MAG: hypothetical protein SFY32_11775 [Bacteroidota bacterium]|nr:hypothetical protein [Bacteroidota bacterium]
MKSKISKSIILLTVCSGIAVAQNYKSNFGYNAHNYKNPVLAQEAKEERVKEKNYSYNNVSKNSGTFLSKANYKQPAFNRDEEVLIPISVTSASEQQVASGNYKMQFKPAQKQVQNEKKAPEKAEPLVLSE